MEYDEGRHGAGEADVEPAQAGDPVRLTRDLLAMGVERRVIDRALAALRADGGESPDVPLALASRRAAQLGNLPRAAKRRRLLAFLARRGFTSAEIRGALARAGVRHDA